MTKKDLILTLILIFVCHTADAQMETQLWADPSVASEGKASPRAEFISYNIRDDAEKGNPNRSQHYLPLAGKWRVNYSTTAKGGTAGFYKPTYSVASWVEVALPNTSTVQGPSQLDRLTPPQLPAEISLVQYRAEIEVPYMWLDREVYIHIEGVGSGYSLFVNDKKVGYSNDSRTPAEYNISKAITDGLNSIGIEVYGLTQGSWLESALPQVAAGTLGKVYIYSQPKISIADFTVTAQPDTLKPNGRVDFAVIMANSYRNAEKITLGYDIYSPEGKLLTYNLIERVIEAESQDTIRVHEIIYSALKHSPWTPQTPKLYRLMLYTRRDGRITEYIPIKIGFNHTKVESGEWIINGKKAELNVVDYNAKVDQKTTESDLIKLKKAKINTVSVGYPQPRWFYELCDRVGMYVIDQANINSAYRTEDRNVGGAVANNPTYLPQFIDRAAGMQGRSKNFTSIIATSMGGENGNGYNLYKTYQWLKGADTLHPVIYRDVQGEWNSDVIFPTVKQARELLK